MNLNARQLVALALLVLALPLIGRALVEGDTLGTVTWTVVAAFAAFTAWNLRDAGPARV